MSTQFSSSDDATVCELKTQAVEQTIALGHGLGKKLNAGINLMLHGDLGSGKTAFTQGLARGLEVPPAVAVTSPTYTLVNEYPGRLPLYHVDLYRLPSPVEPDELGLVELFEENTVVAVEWAGRLHTDDYPPCRLDLFFSAAGINARSIRVIAYGLDLPDLLQDIDGLIYPETL
jgi:tRNA threonylcarbamoyladenosine biosynthesis protein TsaE